MAVKAAASELFRRWMCSSCLSTGTPAFSMPSRSVFSSGGRRRITSARSSRETLALADQIRSAAARFIALVCFALDAGFHGGHRQHVGPDLEQELAHALLDRHLVEHLAQLDGVLDGQRLALLDLLRQRNALSRGLVLVLEVVLEELLELGEHGLEHAPAGVRVGLDDLHDALDLLLEQVADGTAGGIEAHHAGAHAVDQLARRVVDGGEEIGLADRHPQHRHLQPGEPHAHRRRDALFGQDALEQQGHDLDRGPLHRRRRSLLQRLLALVQFFQHGRRADRAGVGARAARGSQPPRDALLRVGNRGLQRRRCHGRRGAGLLRGHELRQLPADQPVEPAEHGLGMVDAAGQRPGARHQAGFLADTHAAMRPRCSTPETLCTPDATEPTQAELAERLMYGRRSTSGITRRWISQRLIS